ncbi:unnamed protein product, partial [Vitis vinifera]
MLRFHVGGKVVEDVDLLRKRHWPWRLDVWPFAILYTIWLVTVVPSIDISDAIIVFGGLVVLHILVWLFTAWSVEFRCFVQYSKVNSIQQADACKITPAKFSGSKEIVPLHFRKLLVGSSSSDVEEIYFDFRKQCFIYSKEKETFFKLSYPSKESFGYYHKSTGHGSEAKVVAATEKWGRNVFEYPQPTFQKLMKENCMEPFFVFQVFCVGLWCLDEYWYYSLFTLFMLFMFESTMAKSRLKTLTELRRVRVDNQTIMVHRCGKWVKLSGTELLPGDVVSIGRSSGQNGEDKTVPADMLILAGSAIVNEAILTGESTPQWKVSIMGRGNEEKLSVKRDKNHVLFGGTKILQHTPDKTVHLKTPDGGCLAVVLRTGFETSQGKLMRTILFSTERVTANSWESGLFILFLVIFAVIAAGYVLKKGLEDPTRSKYKLFLSCSLIITSVIPPELPMELSIAVNTSLIALARRGIFCTEPFRIPFAGKVDICCFDKTGTLTSDDMEFRGVTGLTDAADLESDMSKVPARTVEILASCHALVFVDNKLVGDPLEKAALKGIDWSYKSDEKAVPKKGSGQAVQIVKRHHFASYLKRMSVVVRVQEEFLAFVKLNKNRFPNNFQYTHTLKKGEPTWGDTLELHTLVMEMLIIAHSALKYDLIEMTSFRNLSYRNILPILSYSKILDANHEYFHQLDLLTPDIIPRFSHTIPHENPNSKGKRVSLAALEDVAHRRVPPLFNISSVLMRQTHVIRCVLSEMLSHAHLFSEFPEVEGLFTFAFVASTTFKALIARYMLLQLMLINIILFMASHIFSSFGLFPLFSGAPETIQERLVDLPPSYVETYKKYTRQGSRVLALAFKSLPEMTVSEARNMDRDVVESGLTFAGFAVFNCPIRADSATVLSELKGSSHDLAMITGDQALTACHVAGQVHIISKPTLILGPARNSEGYEWISPDETEIIRYSAKEVEALSETHDLCIGGDCFEMLQQTSAVLQVIPFVKVFARVAPEQKELILTTFKTVGRMTLMCGDGTNDVGALKQAHVGVALLNAMPPTQTGGSSSEASKDETSNLNGEGPSKGRSASKS